MAAANHLNAQRRLKAQRRYDQLTRTRIAALDLDIQAELTWRNFTIQQAHGLSQRARPSGSRYYRTGIRIAITPQPRSRGTRGDCGEGNASATTAGTVGQSSGTYTRHDRDVLARDGGAGYRRRA